MLQVFASASVAFNLKGLRDRRGMTSEASTPTRHDNSLTHPGGLSDSAKVKLFYSAHGIQKLCDAIQNDTDVIAEQIHIASLGIGADLVKMNKAFKKVIAASADTLANAQKLVDKLEQITGAVEGNTGEPISESNPSNTEAAA